MAVSRTEGGLGLMSCVRESSPPDITDAEDVHHEPKKRRFHPLRGLRRMFRRKERRQAPTPPPGAVSADELRPDDPETTSNAPDDSRRRSLHCGLSLSHDSVFSPEQRSGPESGSELETSSSLSMRRLVAGTTGVQAELVDAVRRRRPREDTSDDEDLGLPRSPPSGSPTAEDPLDKVLKENVNKSNHSTCSDGSLLSMGSSEMDEDSYGQSSGHGSKLSLHDKKSESDVEVTSEPLSHSAARHKMSVKPKRNHGVPRKRRSTQLGEVKMLPSTPEVNEEPILPLGRSVTPDLPPNTGTVSAAQLKSASLPPGTAPAWPQSPVKLSRSRSSATNRQLDSTTVGEQDEAEPLKKEDTTFFGRLLSRRSGKKKKTVEELPLEVPLKRMDEKGRYVHEVTKLGRHHPASRQRVEPINISQERAVSRMQVFYPPSPPPPDSPPQSLKETESFDDERNSPLRKVIPLEVDVSIPKRTFIKKSQSFRRDEALPFVSLDTPSLPIGLGSDLPKDGVEDLNELTTLEVVDHHLSTERIEEVKEVTTTVTVNASEELDSCQVTVTTDNVIMEPASEVQVNKSASLESVRSCEIEQFSTTSTSSESISHQITIPVGSSIVNISQTVTEPQQSVPSHNVKPEPRKSLKEGIKDVPSFYPVPAPRPSKRDSLEAKPPKVPEFLRVQLNHVDSKPLVNVVLSTAGSNTEEKSSEDNESVEELNKGITQTKDEPTKTAQNLITPSPTTEEKEVKVEVCKETSDIITVNKEVCVAKEPIDPNQIKFLNSVKQWSASPYSISNPNYSIVALVPKNPDVKKSPEKLVVVSNQNVHKTVVIKEVKEKSHPLVENSQEIPQIKPVLRQRSFVTDDKSTNIVNVDKLINNRGTEDKFTTRKKSIPKDNILSSDIDRTRKLSLEKLDSRNQENINDFSRRRSREMSTSEDNIVDRNSYGSSDTLASQDSGEVVLRRKSLSREIIRQKEEEPELLKVFARRSLKVKDSDLPDDLEALPMKSRDSDKENECGDSPPEERKKLKDHLTESKVTEKITPSVVAFKYQRSISANNEETTVSTSVLATSKKDNNSYEKRQRSRTIPDPKIIDPPSSIVPIGRLASIFVEKDVEVISLERCEDNINEKEDNVPRFKRIQQRKEEWEKRAQLAMMKNQP